MPRYKNVLTTLFTILEMNPLSMNIFPFLPNAQNFFNEKIQKFKIFSNKIFVWEHFERKDFIINTLKDEYWYDSVNN